MRKVVLRLPLQGLDRARGKARRASRRRSRTGCPSASRSRPLRPDRYARRSRGGRAAVRVDPVRRGPPPLRGRGVRDDAAEGDLLRSAAARTSSSWPSRPRATATTTRRWSCSSSSPAARATAAAAGRDADLGRHRSVSGPRRVLLGGARAVRARSGDKVRVLEAQPPPDESHARGAPRRRNIARPGRCGWKRMRSSRCLHSPRRELEEMMRRCVAGERRGRPHRRLVEDVAVLYRGRDLYLEQRPELGVRGARPQADPRIGHSAAEMAGLEHWVYPVRAHADRRSRRARSSASGARSRPTRTARESPTRSRARAARGSATPATTSGTGSATSSTTSTRAPCSAQ